MMPMTRPYIEALAVPQVCRTIEFIALAGAVREQCAESPLDLEQQALACFTAGISLFMVGARSKQSGALAAERYLRKAMTDLIVLALTTDEFYSNSHRADVNTGAAISSPVGPPPAGPVAPVSYFETNFPLAQTLPGEWEGCGSGSSAIKPKVDDRSAPRTPDEENCHG